MTNLTVASANIRALTEHGAVVLPGVASGTLTVGYAVYQNSSGLWTHADANVSATVGLVTGILVESFDGETTVLVNQACSVCVLGPVGGYTTIVPGALYYLSDTVGLIADAFAGAGSFKKIIGVGVKISGLLALWVAPTLTDAASS